MAHGYLGDGYGMHGEIDPDRGENRDHDWRHRGRREPGWRGRDENREVEGRDRDRGMMFGDRERASRTDRDESNRDLWNRPGFDDDYGRDQRGFGGSGDYEQRSRSYSANPDDHYRSWRDRYVQELDSDYADYCREREQQFHRDFNQWRNQRQTRNSKNDEIAIAAAEERTDARAMNEEGSTPSPVAAATLGTNTLENSTTGRASRRS